MPDTASPWGSVGDICRAVLRHKTKAIVYCGLITSAVAVATFLWPKTYRSEGKLLVRLGRENATLDPTATLGQESVVAVPISRDSEINSVVEILQSRSMLEKVVDALGVGRLVEGASAADRERRCGCWPATSTSRRRTNRTWSRPFLKAARPSFARGSLAVC